MHVVDGCLTHGDFLSPLSTWQPTSSPLFNTIFAAAIATILSYQLTAFFVDICFARSTRGKTPVSDIHIKLLIDETSPISLLASVFRRDVFDSVRLHLKMPKHAFFTRANSFIKKRVLAKLAMLVVAAPLFNVLCIIFTIEITEVISFAEAQFGGIAYGFNEDLSTILLKPDQNNTLQPCGRYHITAKHAMRPTASFRRCFVSNVTKQFVGRNETQKRVVLSRSSNGAILMSVSGTIPPLDPRSSEIFRFTFHIQFYAYIAVQGKELRLASELDVDTMRKTMTTMKNRIRVLCAPNPMDLSLGIRAEDVFPAKAVVSKEPLSISQKFVCRLPPRVLGGITSELRVLLSGIITLVDAPLIRIIEDGAGLEIRDGGNLPFARRKRSVVGTGSLCVALVAVLALRVMLSMVYTNNVDNEIESILNKFFGITSRDSLLHYKFRFWYNHKKLVGNEMHYGIALDDGETWEPPR